ncbi:MAG: helix-turn-helix domain-containing protein [Clostridia bacterium]|nr:helix-turn-helix domain-containing protein [Clostridia bacterium]
MDKNQNFFIDIGDTEYNLDQSHRDINAHIAKTALFPVIKPFHFLIQRNQVNASAQKSAPNIHSHKHCELYIHLSGETCFMVKNEIYPLLYGNVLIVPPNQLHHCIYNAEQKHSYYWILFSLKENKELFSFFQQQRPPIFLSMTDINELTDICEKLISKTLAPLEQYIYFFRLISLLTKNESVVPTTQLLSEEMKAVVTYINQNLTQKITIKELADAVHVSVNTLERHFFEAFKITPRTYIQQKRLLMAEKLLRNGSSVLNSCLDSGFSDYPHFIVLFKKHFGLTPLQYKKTFSLSSD